MERVGRSPQFYLGCAVWAHRDWLGTLFPSGSSSSDFLKLYSRRFTTVEGNTTFYSIPDHETVERWASQTPAGFRFCLKLPRSLTHQGLLTPQISGAIAFLERMQSLGDRLGTCFVQLPPSYSPAWRDDLLIFLQAWPQKDCPLALEVRHRDWFQRDHAQALNKHLQDLGIARVLLDTRPIYDCPDDPQVRSERKKPQLPLQPDLTADFTLIRYISHPDPALNEVYWQEWVPRIRQWLQQGVTIYLFVHCPIEARSPQNAQRIQALLEAAQAPVPPLPWNQLEQPATQLRLF
jgi:uncharacterized protein YecE (DUF72 family)